MGDSLVKKPLGQKMMEGISNFLGIGDVDVGTKDRYRKRREKCYRTNLKDDTDVDARECRGRQLCKPKNRQSLYTIVKQAVVAKDKHGQINLEERSRSFRPADLNKVIEGTVLFEELKNELFYDEVPDVVPVKSNENSGMEATGRDELDMGMARSREDGGGAKGVSHMDMAMARPEDDDEYADKY